MRIAFITYEYPPETGKGGIGTYTKQVAEMLVSKGWDVHVFCGTADANTSTTEAGIQLHKTQCAHPHDFTFKVVPVFLAEFNKKKFELAEVPEIHSNASEIKKQLPNLPLIIRLHAPNYLVERLKKKYVPFTNKLRYVLGALRRFKWDAGYWAKYNKEADNDYQQMNTATKIVAPSALMKQWAVTNWNINAEQIEVVPNIFSAPAKFLEIPIEEEAETKTILFFGRLNVLKGLLNATHALKIILKNHPDWKFLVVGDDGPAPNGKGSMRKWMQHKLKELNGNVQFENGVAYEQLPAYLKQADIVILPSLFESFSYTCLEAMAAGKAVVGSKGTGMEAIITHQQDGLLANPNNVNDIVTCIEWLITNKQKRLELAKVARKTASEKFSPATLYPQYQKIYGGAINE